MPGIERKRLAKAKRELASIAERHSGPFRSKDIDWRLIRTQLGTLKVALEKGDGTSFDQALQMLILRLAAPNRLRGKMHSWDNPQKMPRRDLDLLNHIVEQIHNDLQEPSTDQPNLEIEPSAAERDSEGHS